MVKFQLSISISMVNFGQRRHHYASKTGFSLRPLRFYNDSDITWIGNLPTLLLQYNLFAQQDAWRKSPVNQPSQLIYLDEFHKIDTRSFDVELCPSQYMSHDVFFSMLKQHLTNWGDYYEVCDEDFIESMVSYVHKNIEAGMKKLGGDTNFQYLEIFVDVTFKLEHVLDGRITGIPQRLNGGMLPATKTSIIELPERMEIDDDQCLKEIDCAICLEQLKDKDGDGGKIVCIPCSHMFHRHCITTWLNKNHYCPICRYALPTP